MIKQFFKNVLISYLIIICCIFTPTYNAYAVSAGGWAFSSFDVAKNLVTAMKNGATATAAVAKSPITSKIAKGILGGAVAGAAIPLAISQISGIALSAVDWVLDPANNAIKYRPKDGSPQAPTGIVYTTNFSNTKFTNLADACKEILINIGRNDGKHSCFATEKDAYYKDISVYVGTDLHAHDGFSASTLGTYGSFTVSAGTPDNSYKTIPIPTVANKIYDNAKTDSDSRSVVNDAVTQYVNEGSADTALNNAKADADASHNCGSGTYWSGSACVATPSTPSTPTTPDIPFDPSGIIDAINSVFNAVQSVFDAVMSLPDVINQAIDKLLVDIKDFFQPVVDLFTDFFDWVKTTYDEFVKPGDNEPTELDIPNDVPTPTDTNIRFGGMCPPNAEINVRIPFATINATLFDWSKWCYNLDTFVKPVIILLAAYFSVLIFRGKNESS